MGMPDEQAIIARFQSQVSVPKGVVGIGDDTSVWPEQDGSCLLVTTDMLLEGVHFRLGAGRIEDIGWKALVVSLSDVAAMGGRPESAYLSLAVPGRSGMDHVAEGLTTGLVAASLEFSCPLLGGDTCRSSGPVMLNTTVLGRVGKDHVKLRKASFGDVIGVVGTVGCAGIGLSIQETGLKVPFAQYFLGKLHRPSPRLAQAQALASVPGVRGMMDLSDGLLIDLERMCCANGLGAKVNADHLPYSQEAAEAIPDPTQRAQYGLTGGEDYGLLLSVDPRAKDTVTQLLQGEISWVGEFCEEKGVAVSLHGIPIATDSMKPYQHFAE